MQLHPDTPNCYDAWDIDAFYRHVAVDLVDDAELSTVDGGVRVVRRVGASTITQTITLDGGRIDFDTDIDWHETEKLLKVGFDLDVMADRSASEIQFGHVFRPTHANTSWDAAKFEICAHRWIHVGDPGYGVAVVNDSTYGHDVSRRAREGGGVTTLVRLSLLRAPRFPDPDTDQGRHHLRYALVPGAGIVDAAREGYRINLPVREMRWRPDGCAARFGRRRRGDRRVGEARGRPIGRCRRADLRGTWHTRGDGESGGVPGRGRPRGGPARTSPRGVGGAARSRWRCGRSRS